MRTEVKIGIVIGLIVVAGGIILFWNQGPKAGDDMAPKLPMDGPAKTQVKKPETTRDRIADARSPKPRTTPRAGQRPGTDRPTRSTTGRPTTPGTTRRPGSTGRSTSTTPRTGVLTPGTSRTPQKPGPTTRPAVSPGRKTKTTPAVKPRTPVTTQPAVSGTPTGRTPVVTPPPRPDTTTRRPTTRQPAAQKHTVAEGDSLWSIAERYYGDGNLWPQIKTANPGIDENTLKIGQVIVIPPKREPTPAGREARPATGDQPCEKPTPGVRPHVYRVEEGDTLIGIARNILKNGNRWMEIYELNKDKIDNPNVLPVGLELKLPKE